MVPGEFVSFWLPAGLYLATLLKRPARQWPAFISAAVAANFAFDLYAHHALQMSLLYCSANTLTAVLGALLVRKLVAQEPDLTRVRDAAGFAAAVVVATILGASLGAAAVEGIGTTVSYIQTWWLWWSGDFVGILLMAPCLLATHQQVKQGDASGPRASWAEVLAFALTALLLAWFVFEDPLHPGFTLKYVLVMPVIYAALRLGLAGTAWTCLALGIVVTAFTSHGRGDIGATSLTPAAKATALQIFLAVLSFIGLSLAAAIASARRMEEKLQRSQVWTKAVLESISEAFFTLDENFIVTYFNDAAEQVLHRRRADVLGRPLFDAFPEARDSVFQEKYTQVTRERRSISFETYFDREPYRNWYDVRVFPQSDGGISVYFQVTTERKLAEEALKESEERYRLAFEACPMPMWVYDTQTVRFLTVNNAAVAHYGYSKAEFLRMTLRDIRPAEDIPDFEAQRATLPSAFVHTRYWRHIKKDGTLILVRIHSDAVGFRGHNARLVLAEDITAQVKAEEAMRASEERFRAIATNTPDHILMQDRDLRYLWVINPQLGLKTTDMIGRTDDDFLSPTDAQKLTDLKHRVLSSGQPQHVEVSLADRHGTVHHFAGIYTPTRDGAGNVTGLLGYFRNVTDQVHAEQALQQAKDAAEAANKAKDQFIAVLSHELRTPLAPVLMQIESLQRSEHMSESAAAGLDLIRRNVELESRLIGDLLDITAILRGELRLQCAVTDVHACIQAACETCQPQIAAKRHRLLLELEATRHHANADAVRLRQVVWNLVGNAIKYTPEGGHITVRTGDMSDGRMRIDVIDNGIGIAPEVMGRLFQPFVQGEHSLARRYGGLGLGLSIARAIVQSHHGTLEVSSDGEDRGSTFTAVFPVTVAPAAPEERPPAVASTRGMRAKILVVEDNADTLRVMQKLLQAAGHKVLAATSVQTALSCAQTQAFDLLLCDIGLPDGTGWDLMKQLSSIRTVRGLALSGFASAEDIERSRTVGFLGHLTKPLDPLRLEQAIGEALADVTVA